MRTHADAIHVQAPHAGAQHAGRALNSTKEDVQGVLRGKRISKSVAVHRFGYSMVEARLLLLRNASAQRPDWYLFFSESCAPLLPCKKVHAFLKQHQGRSFVENRNGTNRPVKEVRRRMHHSCSPCDADCSAGRPCSIYTNIILFTNKLY